MLETLILSISVLATLANITVPGIVIPDPDYIQNLQDQAPLQQQPQQQQNDNGSAFPTQLTDVITLAAPAVLGFLLKKEHDKNSRRQGVMAETAIKLAENDESTDKGTLDLVYADNVLLDILCQDPIWKQRFDDYKTKYGTNATTFFKDLARNFNQDFESYYEKTHIIPTTKDPIVNTLQKVQDKVTPATTP